MDAGLKVALSRRHLASGTKYRNMQYTPRVPRNSISKVFREVVESIIEEYVDELLRCPTTEQGLETTCRRLVSEVEISSHLKIHRREVYGLQDTS